MKQLIRGLVAGVSIAVLTLSAGGVASGHEDAADRRMASDKLSPEVLAAMQRDLGLSAEAARLRLAQQAKAIRIDGQLRKRLGTAFGGSWFDAGLGRLVVGVTNLRFSDQVRAAG